MSVQTFEIPDFIRFQSPENLLLFSGLGPTTISYCIKANDIFALFCMVLCFEFSFTILSLLLGKWTLYVRSVYLKSSPPNIAIILH